MSETSGVGFDPLDAFGAMCRIRAFETVCNRLAMANRIRGPIHLAAGQEAVSVGVAAARTDGDAMVCTYRGHGHVLAWGAPVAGAMLEVLGRADGLCKGKGGSMHLTSVEHGALGCYAIVGAQIPIAAGVAWADRILGSGGVTVCFFGDGATNIGTFHESLNLAQIWKLPVVFVCENNLYMEYTRSDEVTSVANPAYDRATANGVRAELVDGNDLEAVWTASHSAFSAARRGEGPILIEALTYRHHGHAHGDPAKYRPEQEVEEWLGKDPIEQYRKVLLSRGVAGEDLDGIERKMSAEVEAASKLAEAAPDAEMEEIWTDVWSDGGSAWRN